MKSTISQRTRIQPRRGLAILWVMIVLVLVSAVIGLITSQHLAGRNMLEQRQKRMQADWLARAGIEVGLSRLLDKPQAFSGDITDLLANSKVHIDIQVDSGSTTTFTIMSEAHYSTNIPHQVLRSMTRHVRRVVDKGQVRVEPVTVDEKK
jgi:predicted DNA-binding protein (UPF0278 family)